MIYYSANQKVDIVACDNYPIDQIISKLKVGYSLNVIDGKKTTVIGVSTEVKAFCLKVYRRKGKTSELEMIKAYTGSIDDLRSEIFNLGSGLGDRRFLVKVSE